MVGSRRWKYRAGAVLGLLVTAPFVAEVLLTGQFETTPTSEGQGQVVLFGIFVICALYLPWSFLVERFEESPRETL